ncbi:hypothetical protein QJQ45_023044 [Haematococcus lacustris]|nr:hypothetical protein QJQ45_023044 [Haematococcus lacustris]
MPRKVDICVSIDGCTASHFWNVVYEDPRATVQFHKLANQGHEASATPWVNSTRDVHFFMPLATPDWVNKAVRTSSSSSNSEDGWVCRSHLPAASPLSTWLQVGISSVRVRERQVVVWQSSTSFSVASETSVLNVSAAARFQTSLTLTVTQRNPPPLPSAQEAAGQPQAAPLPNAQLNGPAQKEQWERGSQHGQQQQQAGQDHMEGGAGLRPPADSVAGEGLGGCCCDVVFSVKTAAGMPW